MKVVPIQIRNEAVVRDIRELSALTGKPITEAVAQAVEAELDRRRRLRSREIEGKLKAVRDIVDSFKRLPRIGPMLTDDDLYDEDGMPK
jgi:hypothetical protein